VRKKNISLLTLVLVAFVSFATRSQAQAVAQNRITQPVDNSSMVVLKGSNHPLARAQYDAGQVDPSTRFTGVTIYFKPSAAQQAALDALVQAQQTPGSPHYHQWLSTAQYAAQFGLTASDLAQVQGWLERQGFTVGRISASRNAISFSGSAAQIGSAFQTTIHHYNLQGAMHMANATALSVPSALAGVVAAVRNISDFRPQPLHRLASQTVISPQFTNGASQHFLAPSDFATIYDVQALYNAGYTGSGVTIAIVGQSAIEAADIENFQKASGLTQKAPTMTLVPDTGTSVVDDTTGDEDESDIDVEWSGAVARGAIINFVYVGSSLNFNVLDSLQYAIDNDLAPVVSISYGSCEPDNSAADVAALQSLFEQANAQGQTIVASAGDNGATDCETTSNPNTIVNGDEATQGLAVDLPGSSPFVTSIGGTEFNGDNSSPSTYWNSSNTSGGGSAIQYIPEEVWNDTSTANGLSAGGGGASILFGKPSWQTGTGVPTDGARDVPDISLNASPNHDGYLFCASGADATSCSTGFADSKNDLTIAGGTSFGAPTFAGIVAILNQKFSTKGLGNVNPEIYALASSNPSGFHDVATGNNDSPCVIGSTDCTSSPIGYSATAGYDLASGWGSIDANNFASVFSTSYAVAPVSTTVALTSSSATYTVNTAVTFTATVSTDYSSATPSGTVQFAVDGTSSGSPVTLSTGSATFSYTPTTSGAHTITATYAATSTFAGSSASLNITVASAAGSGSFSLAATSVTVAQGASGTSTVTVTPGSSFIGAVDFTVSAPSSLTNSCYSVSNANVTGTAAVTTTLTIFTSEGACTNTAFRHFVTSGSTAALASPPNHQPYLALAGTAFASLFFLAFPGVRRRRWPVLIVFLAMLPLALSGCGGSKSSSTSTGTGSVSTGLDSAQGTYTLTVTGANSTNTVSASTPLTLTVN
jgi:subtilase family serine protease